MPSFAEYQSYLSLPQVRAALDTVAWAEGANYTTLFGGGTFNNNGPHPNRVISSGGYRSTAAGRYQFLKGTWDSLGLGNMSNTNQDIGALMLMQRRGVLDDVLRGDFQKALTSGGLGKEWASLPFSPYGQTNRTLSSVMSYYNAALNALGGTVSPNNLPAATSSTLLAGTSGLMIGVLGFVFVFLLLDD
jgi:muramidase (phage lysozyme)